MRVTFRAGVGRALCSSALWLGLVPVLLAQEPPRAAVENTVENAAANTGSIVFLLAPELPTAVRAGLTDALEAQLAGTGTTLHWRTLANSSTDLRAAIDQGKPAASEHQAVGVFWLDASGASDWLLYLMDAAGDRILARRIEAAADAPAASIEAIAVIARESATALIAGKPVAMDPIAAPSSTSSEPNAAATPVAPAVVPPPVAPPPTAALAPPPISTSSHPGVLRVALGYVGSPLSADVPWQHGLSLQVALFSTGNLFAGLGYSLLPTLDVSGEGVSIGVERRPVRLLIGFGVELAERLRLDTELTAIADITSRTTRSTPTLTSAADATTQVVFGTGLNTRLNWAPQSNLELYLSLGAEVFFNRFDYAVERDGEQTPLLSPWPVSPIAEIGLAFRP